MEISVGDINLYPVVLSKQTDSQKVMHIQVHYANCTSGLKMMTMIKGTLYGVISGAVSHFLPDQ